MPWHIDAECSNKLHLKAYKMKQVTIKAKATIAVVDLSDDILQALVENKEFIVSQSKEFAHIYTSSTDIIPGDYKVVLSLINLGILECDGGNYDLKTRNYQFNAQNFRIAGTPSQLTEEDWKGIVDDYVNQGKPIYMAFVTDTDAYATAKEAGLSLLKANGVAMENCFGEKPDSNDDYYRDAMGITDEFYKALAEWNKAQKEVWLNPQIFVKI